MAKKLPVISSKPPEKGSRRTRVNRNARVVNVLPGQSDEDGDEFIDGEFEKIEAALKEVDFDNMDKEAVLMEIQKVDKELLRINMRLSGLAKNRRHVFKGDADALNLQLRTLKQRSDMLFKCLDKVLPDKRESKIDLNLNSTEVDQIPDDILAKIVAGTITQEEFDHYAHLIDKAIQQEKEQHSEH